MTGSAQWRILCAASSAAKSSHAQSEATMTAASADETMVIFLFFGQQALPLYRLKLPYRIRLRAKTNACQTGMKKNRGGNSKLWQAETNQLNQSFIISQQRSGE